jgi:hypothetical protein
LYKNERRYAKFLASAYGNGVQLLYYMLNPEKKLLGANLKRIYAFFSHFHVLLYGVKNVNDLPFTSVLITRLESHYRISKILHLATKLRAFVVPENSLVCS